MCMNKVVKGNGGFQVTPKSGTRGTHFETPRVAPFQLQTARKINPTLEHW